MTSSEKKIAFKIEFERILNLLADQIYQSPLALLREKRTERLRRHPNERGGRAAF